MAIATAPCPDAAQRQHAVSPVGAEPFQSGGRPASRQPASDTIGAGAPSLQQLVDYQRGLYERTIPLWQVILARMGTRIPASQHQEHAHETP